MAKAGLETKLAGHAAVAIEARKRRDASFDQKSYTTSIKKMTKDIDEAITVAITNPELGIRISRDCFRFTMLAMPDPTQDSGRGTSLKQCQILEDCLSKVRNPAQYRTEMQEQFGPDLDPRDYPASQDGFASIIKSQKNRIYQEAKGFNTTIEQTFCRKRSDLLMAIEKGYDLLRDKALSTDRTTKKA